MKITDDLKEKIINMGVFEYDSEKIASILEIDISIINKELNDAKSELNKLLEIGKNKSDYVIDLKLFELAKAGDIKALEKLELRKRKRK